MMKLDRSNYESHDLHPASGYRLLLSYGYFLLGSQRLRIDSVERTRVKQKKISASIAFECSCARRLPNASVDATITMFRGLSRTIVS